MTNSKTINTGLFAALAVAVAFTGAFAAPAFAGGKGRDVYMQDYQFDGPTHGYEGRATGGYYCSYQRLSNRQCKVVNGKEVCKIKGWTLRQICQ